MKKVNPEKPKCPSCSNEASYQSSHSVQVLTPKGDYVIIGWWSGWYCSKCGIIFCHHPACQLKWCIKAKKLQPDFKDF